MTLVHYPDLSDERGIVLMQGEYNKDIVVSRFLVYIFEQPFGYVYVLIIIILRLVLELLAFIFGYLNNKMSIFGGQLKSCIFR